MEERGAEQIVDFDFTKRPGRCNKSQYKIDAKDCLVSIISPFFNSGEYFEETYLSVINQTFPYFEWIIVDDGSTNSADLKILDQFAALDPRIKVFHKANGGASSARNFAVQQAAADIIIPLDADDLIEPNFIECLYIALLLNPEASWAYTDGVGFQKQEYLWRKEFSSDVMKRENILVCTAAIRKKDFLEVEGYSEVAKYFYEDWHLWLKMLSKEKIPVHLRQFGFWYRRTEDGVLIGRIGADTHLQKQAKQITETVLQAVPSGLKAIEPYQNFTGQFKKPYSLKWERTLQYQTKKTRILMLIPHMEMGGADVFNLDILSRINREQFDIGIITTIAADSTWRQKFAEYATDIFELPSFLHMDDWAAFIDYYIKSRNIDILLITNSYYGYYLAPWLRKEFPNLAIVDYVHMEEWYWRAGGYARTSAAVGQLMEKTYVCNEHLRQLMIEQFDKKPEEVGTLYIGVDEQFFDARKANRGKIRKQFQIAEDRPVILFPCRIHPQKRPFLMLEIAERLKKRFPTVCFLVVGDGPQLAGMRNKAAKNNLANTVYFVGRQEDMRSFYADSDVTLICSIKEGLSLTAYESLSMGVPVVSSDVGGQGELVDDEVGKLIPLMQDESDDFDARSFSDQEIEVYVQAITELLADKERYLQICKNCRAKIEQRFTKQLMITALENEFRAIMAGRGREKREKVAAAVQTIGHVAEDYLALYNEYERLNKDFQYIHDVLLLKESPIRVLKEILYRKDSRYVKAILRRFGLGRRFIAFMRRFIKR